jgi:hypothetical protein
MKIKKNNRMHRFLLFLTVSVTVGFQTWRTLFNNFAVETASLDGVHVGIIQSAREIPGFLTLLVIFVIMVIKERRLSALSVMVMGAGVALTGFFPSYLGILFTTVAMSFGFHYYETTNQSLTLQYFDTKTSPLVFGKQRSLAAASNVAVGVAIYLMAPRMPYISIYLIIGALVVAAGAWGLFQNPDSPDIPVQHKKMIFKSRYWLYYFLNFMSGARRQIFVAFAVFLLVKKFHFTVQEITILFLINNIVNFFLSPLIGKAIIRFGERKVLSLEYFSLIFIFIAYAFAQSKMTVAGLYILDHVFFNFAIAIRTYFQKIGDPKDIAPSMAVGFTINHIAAVVLPAAGGLLWMIDYRIPFFMGAFLSLISLAAVQKIDVHIQK